jgi:[ribosomal protein S5]-alanine N-acetyltransferase
MERKPDRDRRPGRVVLRHPDRADLPALLALARGSRRLHRPWVILPTEEAAFEAFVEQADSARFQAFLICLQKTGGIVGVAIFSGVFQSAYLGFYANQPYAGRGLMKEGLQLALRQAFRGLKLHRVEANIQPGNERSLALVQSLDFHKEGFSPRYLKIGGRWRDHERWAKLAPGA